MGIKTNNSPSSSSLTLNSGFSKKIYNDELQKIDDDYSPHLAQILSLSTCSKNHVCVQTGKEEWVYQVMMLVVDSDGIVLNCKMVTQMMGFTGVLAAGAVLELLQFRALSFAHHSP